MIYNVVPVSAVQQNDSLLHIYTFFFKVFFSIMVYPRRKGALVTYCTNVQRGGAIYSHHPVSPGSMEDINQENTSLFSNYLLKNLILSTHMKQIFQDSQQIRSKVLQYQCLNTKKKIPGTQIRFMFISIADNNSILSCLTL